MRLLKQKYLEIHKEETPKIKDSLETRPRALLPYIDVKYMNESCHTYERVTSHIRTSHVTHIDESCHTYQRVRVVVIRNPNVKRKQSQVPSFSFDPIEFQTQKEAYSVCWSHFFGFAKKTKKTRHLWPQSQVWKCLKVFEIVAICDNHRYHKTSQMVTNLVWLVQNFKNPLQNFKTCYLNLDRNGSHVTRRCPPSSR